MHTHSNTSCLRKSFIHFFEDRCVCWIWRAPFIQTHCANKWRRNLRWECKHVLAWGQLSVNIGSFSVSIGLVVKTLGRFNKTSYDFYAAPNWLNWKTILKIRDISFLFWGLLKFLFIKHFNIKTSCQVQETLENMWQQTHNKNIYFLPGTFGWHELPQI